MSGLGVLFSTSTASSIYYFTPLVFGFNLGVQLPASSRTMKTQHLHPTPIGTVRLVANDQGLTELKFLEDSLPDIDSELSPILQRTCEQLDAYFANKLAAFDLPLAPEGTEFQQQVWRALVDIPFGETRYYGQLADQMGNPKAMRAVGAANGRNPISIIIPCHRVVGKSGKLTGYEWGLERKDWLLRHEGILQTLL